MQILVVEDSTAMRAYLRAALESLGFDEVTEAASGAEALRVLSRGAFALVLVDINMPGLSGLELLAWLRRSATHPTVPVLVVTTEGRDADRARALALGADGYVTKPFTPEVLRAAIRALPGMDPVGQG